jgi:outer membrane receptor protein involved in Fe transport
VNTSLPEAICGPALDVYGLRATDIPPTYAADTVWSYEIGGKFRVLGDRMQINAAMFRIDWEDAQINVNPGFGCGIPFVANAGQARSSGLEVEAQAQIGWHLTASAAVSLIDARYTEDAVTLERDGFFPLISAFKGQKLATSPLTLQLGLRSDFQLGSLDAFARADWRYAAGYEDTAAQVFGLSTYAPDTVVPDTSRVNLRVGVTRGEIDLILFANNVLNERDGVSTGGRFGCRLASAGGDPGCPAYALYNPFFQVAAIWPRQLGFRVNYRFN